MKWVFNWLCVKGKTEHGPEYDDFFFCALNDIESGHTGDFFDKCDSILRDGVSFPLNEDYQRDGCYDEEEVFLVYEPDDLRKLMALCVQAIAGRKNNA